MEDTKDIIRFNILDGKNKRNTEKTAYSKVHTS